MVEFFSYTLLVIFGIGLFVIVLILVSKQKEKDRKIDNIYAAISASNITSIDTIAKTLNLGFNETRDLIEEIIKRAKNNNKDYKILHKAYIDHSKGEVILHPEAHKNILNKTIDYVLDGIFPKKNVKKEWICAYCDTANKVKLNNCLTCGANRTG